MEQRTRREPRSVGVLGLFARREPVAAAGVEVAQPYAPAARVSIAGQARSALERLGRAILVAVQSVAGALASLPDLAADSAIGIATSASRATATARRGLVAVGSDVAVLPDRTRLLVRRRPGMAMAVALAVGFALGFVLRLTYALAARR